MLEWTRPTVGTECEAGEVALKEHLQVWLQAVRAPPEPGPLCSQILTAPVACHSPAKTGAHLWNTVCLPIVPAEWDAGSPQSVGSKRAQDTSALLAVTR